MPEEKLWQGTTKVKEAIGNCVEHAYLDDKGEPIKSKSTGWWMFGGIVDERIVFVVCDLGLGIPRTLGIRNNLQDLKRRVLRWPGKYDFKSDAGCVEIACRLGKSRIGDDKGRGRGLAQLIGLMQHESGAGSLFVWSNKGLALYRGLSGMKPLKNKLEFSVRGTIIGWTSPVLEQ